jgi:hypothetical protein
MNITKFSIEKKSRHSEFIDCRYCDGPGYVPVSVEG